MTLIDKQTLLDIHAAIRKSFSYRSPHYHAVLMRVKTKELGPRGGSRFRCEHCQLGYARAEIQIDHINPVVPIGIAKATMSPEEFYRRCFVTPDKLQSLCKNCHKKKCNEEVKERAKNRRLGA